LCAWLAISLTNCANVQNDILPGLVDFPPLSGSKTVPPEKLWITKFIPLSKIEKLACVEFSINGRADRSIHFQNEYVRALKKTGWNSCGGSGNGFAFERNGSCLAMVGFPSEKPHNIPGGPLPKGGVYCFTPEKWNTCARFGCATLLK
jgi:hypothetical protein